MLRQIAVFLLGLLCYGHLSAQNDLKTGYIITLEHDSINGFVKFRDNDYHKSCIFLTSEHGESKSYTPTELIAYGFLSESRFVSMQIVDNGVKKQAFAKQLIGGTVSLFQYRNIFIVNDSVGHLVHLEKHNYKERLNGVVMNCRLSAAELDYSSVALSNLVKNYNRCRGGDFIEFKERPTTEDAQYHVMVGFESLSLSPDDEQVKFGRTNSVTLGAGINFSVRKINPQISFLAEVWFHNRLYQGLCHDKKRNLYTIYDDYVIKSSGLRTPLGIRYRFSRRSNSPYVQAGAFYNLPVRNEVKVTRDIGANGVYSDASFNTQLTKDAGVGFWGGVGICAKVFRDYKAVFELRAEKTKLGNVDEVGSVIGITSFSFNLGVKF